LRIAYRILMLAGLATLIAGVATAQNYGASLDGLQEVPPNNSPATGSAMFVLDANQMLHVTCNFSGLLAPVTAAHIHAPAPPGVNAGIRFPLIPPAPPTSPIILTVGPLTAQDVVNLNTGLSYINIHTTMFPGGEIRGQIFGAVSVEPGTWGRIKGLYN